jgi:hypothetical protein
VLLKDLSGDRVVSLDAPQMASRHEHFGGTVALKIKGERFALL